MSLRRFSSVINKACINCKYYTPYKFTNPQDEIYYSNTKHGTCSKYEHVNVVTGKVTSISALECREDKTKCGLDGKYYEEEKRQVPVTNIDSSLSKDNRSMPKKAPVSNNHNTETCNSSSTISQVLLAYGIANIVLALSYPIINPIIEFCFDLFH